MSREIRRVPPDWKHPQQRRGYVGQCREQLNYIPMFDKSLREAQQEWDGGAETWHASPDALHVYDAEFCAKYAAEYPHMEQPVEGELVYPDYAAYAGPRPGPEAFDQNGHPIPFRMRHWTPEEATAYQVYETVSEGTPISPVFKTEDDLRDWLITEGYEPAAAERFISGRWAPSGVLTGDGTFVEGIHALGELG
jgi:hypothetical protein